MVWVVCPDVTGTIFKKEPDPLNLKDFWPCPRPLYGTMTSDTLVPVPDYIEYQDQAEQLDELSERMALVESAIQVRGYYDASMPEMAQLLQNRAENKLIPIENWAAYIEKGAFEGTISLLPLDMLVTAYQALEDCFEKKLQRLYEITGIADIIRGNSDPDETYGAQKIKSNFATLRLKDRQKDVAVFCRDVIRIMVELIATKFSPQTIAAMTGLADQSQPDAMFFQQAMQLVSDARLRSFRVDVENQSTVELDAEQTRAAATEFLAACAQFIEASGQAAMQMPMIRPLLGQMLLWGVRQFRTGREIENAFEQFVDELTALAKQPQQQPADPKMMEAMVKKQQADQEAQVKIADMQHNQQMEGHRFQFEQLQHKDDVDLERAKAQFEMQLNREKMQNEMALKKMELEGKMTIEHDKHQHEQARAEREAQHVMMDRDRHYNLAERQFNQTGEIERTKIAHDGAHRDKDREERGKVERERIASEAKHGGARK
jgi:hypothetical protein